MGKSINSKHDYICWENTEDIGFQKTYACELLYNKDIVLWSDAIYPPADAKLFENVPINKPTSSNGKF